MPQLPYNPLDICVKVPIVKMPTTSIHNLVVNSYKKEFGKFPEHNKISSLIKIYYDVAQLLN